MNYFFSLVTPPGYIPANRLELKMPYVLDLDPTRRLLNLSIEYRIKIVVKMVYFVKFLLYFEL